MPEGPSWTPASHPEIPAGTIRVRSFWDSLGFDVAPAEEPGRYRGVRD
jgi:hypothetical protein